VTRYYFYQADLYQPQGDPSGVDRLLGSNHGVYVVEDERTPDAIFDQILKELTDGSNRQYEENARSMNVAEPEPSGFYYVMKQFHAVT
jgi:hypothetical protein